MRTWVWLAGAALTLGCGGRPSAWDEPFVPASNSAGLAPAYGLTGSVAVVDTALQRVTLLSSPAPLLLEAQFLPLGKDLATAQTSADRQTLFVLSRGVQPQRKPDDEPPQLELIDGSVTPKLKRSYTLTQPMDQLALDPKNEWAVLYGGSGVVVNPNELELVDLTVRGADAVTSKTLRSFGGKPNRFTFTAPLAVPGGDPKRFLIVERDSDLVLIDLANPGANEVTVPLPATDSGGTATSAQVTYDADSATIAVRVTGTTSVFLLQLAAPAQAGQDFSVVTNLVDVGGLPAAIAFVHNTQGLRLVALVGSSAVLVDPVTAITQSASMPAAFTGIRLITDELNPDATAPNGDVALLYGPNITQIAYFNLGGAPGALFRSIEPYDIGVSVKDVIDVPGQDFFDRKILETPSNDFYVLDLTNRQSAPMKTQSGLTLEIAPDGDRVWAFQAGTFGFATVDFDTLHPISLQAERAVTDVFDIAAASGGRTAVALHLGVGQPPGIGATALNALAPSTATARFYSGFELGGIR
ncbi:MAG: hypothetical protein ABI548_23440 [Polyangiaceae bacterium]